MNIPLESILVLNAGSSSLKYCVYQCAPGSPPQAIKRGQYDSVDAAFSNLPSVVQDASSGLKLAAVGHRIVHGGDKFSKPAIIDQNILQQLRDLIPLAPLHEPHNIAGIETVLRLFPDVPQVACFDTAFHREMPELAQLVAVPQQIRKAGVRRYGFHGLSYEYITSVLPSILPDAATGRFIAAHLGAGASLCAIRNLKSVECTFGFTALDGLCMGTRAGAIDPGVILYLLQNLNYSADRLEKLLYRESGLLGISGITSDMRELLASPEPSAKLAVDYFVYRAAQEMGSLTATLGGLDGLIFTAGIGEHSPEIRKRICESCRWLGVELDEDANQRNGSLISKPQSRISAWVVPTDEELMIARETAAII